MGLNLRKFWVLTWKTLIVKGRHYIETFLDLIVPTFLFMILAVLRYQGGDFLKPTNQPDEIFDTNQFLKKICDMRFDELNNATFYFAPAGGAVDDLMNRVLQANEYFENGGCSNNPNSSIFEGLALNIPIFQNSTILKPPGPNQGTKILSKQELRLFLFKR